MVALVLPDAADGVVCTTCGCEVLEWDRGFGEGDAGTAGGGEDVSGAEEEAESRVGTWADGNRAGDGRILKVELFLRVTFAG